MIISNIIKDKIKLALLTLGIKKQFDIKVKSVIKNSFGDYYTDSIIKIANKIDMPSIELAKKVSSLLMNKNFYSKIEVINPGFINLFISPIWLSKCIKKAVLSYRLNISKVSSPENIVIDYSSPNIAKEMHVGHMRSTIIGDSIARILLFLGHKVIKVNHLGDWGTQFGMLIAFLKKYKFNFLRKIDLSDIEYLYCLAKKKYDKNQSFARYARNCVVKLQNNDKSCNEIWRKLVNITVEENQKIYNLLNITLKKSDIMGESSYKNIIPDIIDDLKYKGLSNIIDGANVILLKEFKNKNGQSMGIVIKKNDGAYLYATTDIAAIKYRCEILKADRIIYYIDSRQHQYLKQILNIARKANYVPKCVLIEHHTIGMVLNKKNKPFKTREGNNIKLIDLIHESYSRAKNLFDYKRFKNNNIKINEVSKIIGIGALKYSDLSKKRTTNYIFNWNKALNFEGNTAPYIQYSYVRIISILKLVGIKRNMLKKDITLKSKYEINLAILLIKLEEVILLVAGDGMPHILCDYLYRVANYFSIFYENCIILDAKSNKINFNYLQLAFLTARIIKKGLNLLGIKTVEMM